MFMERKEGRVIRAYQTTCNPYMSLYVGMLGTMWDWI